MPQKRKIINIILKTKDPKKTFLGSMDPSLFLDLPQEVHAHILTNIHLSNLKPLLLTNRDTYNIVANNYLFWKEKYDQEIESSVFDDRTIQNYTNCLREKYLDRNSLLKCLKEIRVEIDTGQSDITRVEQVFNGSENEIYTSSDDHTIKIFKNYRHDGELKGHLGGIWTFAVNKKYLVSGSTDKCVRICNLETRVCMNVLKGHRSTVRCLKLSDDYIISGSRDADIRIWSYNGTCIYTLKGHSESVRCMDVNDSILVSGSYDGSVIAWDYRKGKKLCNLKKHDLRVYCVLISENYIMSGSQDSKIFVSNLKGKLKYTLKGHHNIVAWLCVSRLSGRERYLFSSGADGTIAKWDLDNGKRLYKIHQWSHITSMKIWNDVLVVSTNHTVNLYDSNNGRLIRNLLSEAQSVYDVSFKDNSIVIGYKNVEKTYILVFDYRRAG